MTFGFLSAKKLNMKLNTKKIKRMLAKAGHKQIWLANKMKISRQLMSYKLKSEHINHVDGIAKALGVPPKDLIS